MSFQDEANKIKKEATDLDNLVDKMEKNYNDMRDDLKSKEQEVRKLLEKGKSEQQVGDMHALSSHWNSRLLLGSERTIS